MICVCDMSSGSNVALKVQAHPQFQCERILKKGCMSNGRPKQLPPNTWLTQGMARRWFSHSVRAAVMLLCQTNRASSTSGTDALQQSCFLSAGPSVFQISMSRYIYLWVPICTHVVQKRQQTPHRFPSTRFQQTQAGTFVNGMGSL